MGLAVEWVAYGRPAAEALRAAVGAAKGGDPLAPVTVVVTANHVGVAARRLLASNALGAVCPRGTGLAAVSFVTPFRLAELVAAPRLAADGRRPVSTPVIAAALRAELEADPGSFRPVADHPATETALVAAYRELRDLSPAALSALGEASARAEDVIRLHRAARRRLAPSFYDEQDLLEAATSGWASVEPVVMYLPQRLSRRAGAFLAAVAERGSLTVVAGTTGVAAADAEVGTAVRRLGGPDGRPAVAEATMALQSAGRARLVTTSDADEEVRAVVRALLAEARQGIDAGLGCAFDRMAVLYPTAEPYARLLHEHLAAAGIPTNGSAVVPLAARVAGRALLELLELPARGYRRRDVLAWLVALPASASGRGLPVAAWERLSRQAGVVAGRVQWDERLDHFVAECRAAATSAEADPDVGPAAVERLRADAERAASLRTFALALIDSLERAAAVPARWSERAAWAADLLERHVGGAEARAAWPTEERVAAERVERALRRLAALDVVEGAVTLEVFTRTLVAELDADLGRTGRLGEGVAVGPVGLGVGLDLAFVAVLGMVEGSYPAPCADDALLPDDERRRAAGELELRSERTGRQQRELLAALASAPSQWIGIPRGDLRRSAQRVPSRWALDLAAAISGEPWTSAQLLRAERPWLTHVPSFAAGLRRADAPATAQEHRLASQQRGQRAGDPLLDRAGEVVTGRRSARFTHFDGNLAGLDVPSPTAGLTSATRLERWAGCPFAYFQAELLGVEPVDNPEEQLQLSPLDHGEIVHRVLEAFVGEALARPEHDQPAPGTPWTEADHHRLEAIAAAVCDDYERRGRTGRPIFWRRARRLLLNNLLAFLHADDMFRAAHGARPLATELPFGLRPSGPAAVAVPLPDGRVVRFRGKADRVDLAADGSLHVLDYKTGKRKPFNGLSEADPDLGGRKLQLPVYGLAARQHHGTDAAPVVAEYWFISARERFVRVGYEVTAAVLDHVGATLAAMVDGIEAGAFPPRPTATATSPFVECPYCDPDGLGVTELRQQWERKQTDPALARFADLPEPADTDLTEPADACDA